VTDAGTLARIGIRHGEPVRFRRAPQRRWHTGRISAVAHDGSVLVHDTEGATRPLRPEDLEVRRPGVRGRLVWRNLAEVAVTWEQLPLW
jgi:hypothetical protein